MEKYETASRIGITLIAVLTAVYITSISDINPNLIWVPIMLSNVFMWAKYKKV